MKSVTSSVVLATTFVAAAVGAATYLSSPTKSMIGTPTLSANKNMEWDKATAGVTTLTDLTAR